MKMKVYIIDLRFIGRLFNFKRKERSVRNVKTNQRFFKFFLKNYIQTS